MPGTSAQRTQKYIDKLKSNGRFDDFKKKKAEREKSRRENLKESLKKLTESKRKQLVDNIRLKCRERVKKYRQKRKQVQSQQSQITSTLNTDLSSNVQEKQNSSQHKSVQFVHSYKTESALAKATTKFRKLLPSSPGKQKAIIAKLLYSLNDDASEEIILNKTKKNKGGKKGIGSKVMEEITQFYERDDISRMSPNTKDSRYYRNSTTGEKELKQKRFLVLTLNQAYQKFIIENAEKYPDKPSVKLSKFCASRPPHVQLVNSTPQNVCLCIYHENFIQCCTVLHKHLSQFPAYGAELKRLLTCNDSSKDCWFKSCADCLPDNIEKKLRALIKGNEKKEIKWWQWEKDEETNRTEKKDQKGTVKKLFDYFITMYQAFLKHSFTNRQQADSFKEDQKYVDSHNDECLLLCDFAENWTNESQDEVVNAHWNQKQISLFTISLRYSTQQHSKVIVSDNLDHSKEAIVAYLYKVLSTIPKNIKTVRIWSDGPNNQFKNKFMAAALKTFEIKFRKKIIWNYHATAHGKTWVDGIGATAKKKIKRMVKSRKSVVNCAKEFVDSFKREPSKVELIEMTKADIIKVNKLMKLDNLVKTAPNVKGISKFHQLQYINNNIKGFLFSKDGYSSLKL